MTGLVWDCGAFAVELNDALTARPNISLRMASAEAGVSPSTFSRAASGWPDLSHTNYLKLRAWLDRKGEKAAA